MLEKDKLDGYFIAVDGPNGVGKSTLIEAIKNKLEVLGYAVYITRAVSYTHLMVKFSLVGRRGWNKMDMLRVNLLYLTLRMEVEPIPILSLIHILI